MQRPRCARATGGNDIPDALVPGSRPLISPIGMALSQVLWLCRESVIPLPSELQSKRQRLTSLSLFGLRG